MGKQQTLCVHNLRPRILRGVVGTTEYEVLVGGSADVDSRLAVFWKKQGDVEILRKKEPEQNQETTNPPNKADDKADDKDNVTGQAALPGTDKEVQKHSGFHGK